MRVYLVSKTKNMKYLYYSFSLLILLAFSSCTAPRYYSQATPQNNYPQQDPAQQQVQQPQPVQQDQSQYAQQDPSQQVQQDPSQNEPITYQQFYDQLSPYGSWVSYQDYGYVWVPDIPDFQPYYSNGQWVYTDYGWTWASDYSWGWAPFHYGRWLEDPSLGWLWVPGYDWGPAWVSWRGSSDYYGWAPLGPRMDINASVGSNGSWCFVPSRYINSPHLSNYYVDRSTNVTIINKTTIINNTTNNTTIINHNSNNHVAITNDNRKVYVAGPSITDVERTTNITIKPVQIVNRSTPGTAQVSKNSVSMYRPPVKTAAQQPATVKPARVFNTQEVANKQKNNVTKPNVVGQQTPVQNNNNVNIAAPNANRVQETKVQPQSPPTNPIVQPQANRNNPGANNNPPAVNNKPSAPVNNPPTNNVVKQQPRNQRHVPAYQQQNMMMQTVRPAQRVTRVQPQQQQYRPQPQQQSRPTESGNGKR